MDVQLKNIKEEALKNRVWTISVGVLGILVMTAMLMFYRPTALPDKEQMKAKENEIKIIKDQNVVLHQIVKGQNRSLELYEERDSVIKDQIILNRQAIEKIKVISNENIKRFDNYGSNEWASYFSKLPEPRQ